MNTIKTFSSVILRVIAFIYIAVNHGLIGKEVGILLVGDSTTEGGKPVFEQSIEQILSGFDHSLSVEVINRGKGGETAFSLFETGRYEDDIKGVDCPDYIFLRYGINDWLKREQFEENFPKDLKYMIARFREDFPDSKIVMMTIIPFLSHEDSAVVNEHITNVAAMEKVDLFDIYPAYTRKIDETGENSMNVRFFSLSEVPSEYHKLLEPYTKFYQWKNADWVRVQSNEFDPLFGDLPGWYSDKHPNTTGYRFLALQTVQYVLEDLKKDVE